MEDYQSLLPLAIIAIFIPIGWMMIFFQTYRHFPKMERNRRLWMSFVNATGLSLFISAICYIAIRFVMEGMIG